MSALTDLEMSLHDATSPVSFRQSIEPFSTTAKFRTRSVSLQVEFATERVDRTPGTQTAHIRRATVFTKQGEDTVLADIGVRAIAEMRW